MNSRTKVNLYVCNAGWKDLQQEPYGPILDNNVIDAAITSGKPFHLRLNLGRYSPTFAAALTGEPPIPITDPQDGNNGDVPVWWSPPNALVLAQANLITRLAERYDSLISAIYMATNMTIYAEPFIRQTGSKDTRSALLAVGYNALDDQDSYYDCLAMFEAFKETRVAWAFNPHQFIDSSGAAMVDTTFTVAMINEMRHRFSTNSIIQNNSIRYPVLGGEYKTMYDAMKGMKPLNFQTATMARIGDLAKTLDWAISMGANRVELNPGYETHLTAKQIDYYNAGLKANA